MSQKLSARSVVAVLLTLALFTTAACSSSSDSSGEGGSGPGFAEGEFALDLGEAWPDGSWAGEVEGTDALIAIVAGPEGVVAYVCDDEEIGNWYRADTAAGATTLADGEGNLLTAQFDGDDLVGSVQLPDLGSVEFTAPPAGDDALHRSFGFDDEEIAVAGWVTLPSGEQRGTISIRRITRPTVTRPTRPTAPTTTSTTTTTTTTTTVRPSTPPRPRPRPRPTVVKAPPLQVGAPVTAPKVTPAVTSPSTTITLSPPNPMTPDQVGLPTPNSTAFVWAAIGDSYAAGEGAPVRPGGFGPGIARPDWGPAINNEDPELAVSVQERESCHRSEKAGAPVANETLKREFPEVTFHFIHYACSGATTEDVMKDGYVGPDRGPKVRQDAQGERAAQFAEDHKAYDALYMSIGGNDAGFGDVIIHCLINNTFIEEFIGDDCHNVPMTVGEAEVPLEQNLANLPARYRELDAYLRSRQRPTTPRHILITKNPDPTSGPNGTMCGSGQGLDLTDPLGFISVDEARWARDVVLEGGMNTAIGGTSSLGWRVIDSHLPGFRTRGFCSPNRLINSNSSALALQGDDYDVPGVREGIVAAATAIAFLAPTVPTFGVGAGLGVTLAIATAIAGAATVQLSSGLLHPNIAGYGVYATAIEAGVRPLVEEKLAMGLLPPARVRVASAVNNQRMTIRWDDLSTSEDRYEVTVTRLEGTGSVPSGVTTLPANAQELEIVSNGPVAVRVEVRACVRSTCSEPTIREAANFIPKTPTGGTGGYVALLTGPPLDRTSVTANAGWLPSAHAEMYVIEYRQITPSATEIRRSANRFSIGGLNIADPKFNSSGAPKALYGVKISACNRAGCSTFSAEVQVDARKDPEIVDLSTDQARALTVPLAAEVLDQRGRNQAGPTAPAMPGEQAPRPGSPVTLPL